MKRSNAILLKKIQKRAKLICQADSWNKMVAGVQVEVSLVQ